METSKPVSSQIARNGQIGDIVQHVPPVLSAAIIHTRIEQLDFHGPPANNLRDLIKRWM